MALSTVSLLIFDIAFLKTTFDKKTTTESLKTIMCTTDIKTMQHNDKCLGKKVLSNNVIFIAISVRQGEFKPF